MRLRPHHVALLSPLERKVYAPLIGNIDLDQERRDLYIRQSHKYIAGDENLLPYPERSKRGIMLFTLGQQLFSPQFQAAAVYSPKVGEYAMYIKKKLLALGADRAYSVQSSELLAAIYGKGKSPFWFYRESSDFTLSNLHKTESPVICAFNPPTPTLEHNSEHDILGIFVKKPEEGADFSSLPLFEDAARLGLVRVEEVSNDRFWLSREPEEK